MFAYAFMMFVADSFRYHVPESVESHIDYITPGVKLLELDDTNLSRSKMKKRSPDDNVTLFPRELDLDLEEILENGPPGCDVVISPDCIRSVSPSFLEVPD
jgi:tripeptidyl-peptidase-1